MREEEKKTRHIFGLDFGTSNTHMSISTAAEAFPIVDDVKLESNASVPSVILYDERTFEVLGFGQPALEEWYSMSSSQRKKYTLGTGFKQRLAFNKRAETETELFMEALFSNLEKQKIFEVKNFMNNTEMACGVPSKTIESHTQKISTILSKLIGRTPVLIEEPLGALFYHLLRKDITKEDGRGGVLVIDFGGGTLDLAYIKNFKIQKVWGSPLIGGILFDDLFYNLFLEQNPKVKSTIEKEGLSGYLRTVLFKNLKEKYSVLNATSGNPQFSENIVFGSSLYGTLKIPNLEYLLEKMRHYQMSKELKHDLMGSNYLDRISVDEKIDLPKIITQEVLRGKREYEIRTDTVSLVILTGGSSRWQFFIDIIEKEFPYTRILASSDPEATISRGLGLCYSAKLYEKKVRSQLSTTKGELIKRLEDSYKKSFKASLEQYTHTVYSIYSHVIQTVVSRFIEKGGSIAELEGHLREAFSERQFELERLNEGFLQKINYEIDEKTKEELSRWFNRSLINYEFLDKTSVGSEKLINANRDLSILNDVVYSRITVISSVIVGIFSGTLLGGGGIALITAGPLGWLGGFIAGVLFAIASAMGLKKTTTDAMKKIKIPKWVMKTLFISKNRVIKNAKKKLEKDLTHSQKKIYETFLKLLRESDEKLELLIEEQIQEISYSNILDF